MDQTEELKAIGEKVNDIIRTNLFRIIKKK